MSVISPANTGQVAALVVGYQPDLRLLDGLLAGLLAEVDCVVLLDNGGSAAYLADQPIKREKIRYIDMGGNRGLGAALNRGMQAARAAGYRYVATFDQDSAPPLGMIAALHAAMREQQEAGIACAAVGPTFYDMREASERCFPLYKETDGRIEVMQPSLTPPGAPHTGSTPALQEVDVLITSGMLVDSEVWADGLQYDEGLVVDYTDTDWCFRTRAAGKRLFALCSVQMPHALSDTPPVRFLGVHLLRYTPIRRYYYFRNTAYFVRRPYVSPAWRRRLLAGLLVRICGNLLIDKQRLRGLMLSLKGLWHGLRGRLGVYPS